MGNSGNSGWLYFRGLQNHCSHEIRRCLLLGRKVMSNLDSVLKNRGITLLTKVHIVKVMVFPLVMYGCESWTIKKAECQRNEVFELWWWRRLLRVPWTARRSNQSNLKKIKTEHSLEGLMLKLQYFGHLIPRADSLEKTLTLGRIEGRRRRQRQRMRWLSSITDSWTCIWAKSRRWWRTGSPAYCSQWVTKSWTQLSDWSKQHWELLRFCILS